jgi:hypothetical protein
MFPPPATASAEGAQLNGRPFPATASAEGRLIKGGPSLWERGRVRGFVPRPTGPLTPRWQGRIPVQPSDHLALMTHFDWH